MRRFEGATWTAARDDALYQAFPDVALLPSGDLLAVWRESDAHVPRWTRLMLARSADGGATWDSPAPLAAAGLDDDGWVWNCPRVGVLSDGRVEVHCDRRDDPREHACRWENWIWWSADEGRTWSAPRDLGCWGLVPDRLLELPGGDLLLGLHYHPRGEAARLKQVVYRSADGGATWSGETVIADVERYLLCEGSLIRLTSGELLCFMRENSGQGHPTFVSRSRDDGRSWSPLEETDMIGHRPVAGQLPSGKVLVTYRDVGGSRSVCAWLGDSATLRGTILLVEHDPAADCGYTGWVRLPDGRIVCLYYLRGELPQPEIRACHLRESDFYESS